ncbi:MAG: beta-galactosidase trimerization domain-containing protein [Anaerolineae bacterium]
MSNDDFLLEKYNELYDTPIQRKFRRIRPMPVGVVFIQWPGQDWDDIRDHLQLMKRLGYTALKGFMLLPGFDRKRFMHMALDEGLIPWWHGEAGWEEPTDELLDELGIPRDTPIEELRENGAFLAYQEQVLRERIDNLPFREQRFTEREPEEKQGWAFSVYHELITNDARIDDEAIPAFTAWLRERYTTLDNLKEAWNTHHAGISGHDWTSWEQAVAQVTHDGPSDRDFNRFKDVIRFKTGVFLDQVRERIDRQLAHDPDEPVRAGGEMSVFFPLAGRGIDMEGIADVMAERGSLYPSTHLAWHFDKVGYEITRPVYMYSSIVHDVFKGGWSATWESTGGPQQISGDKGWSFESKFAPPSYTVDAGVMTQLMLSYLAAGYKGFGFWSWSARTAGREAGEYSLLDRNLQPGPRAVRVGQIGQAARRYRDELWAAHKEPLVGVLFDQENDIQWSVMAAHGRDLYMDKPVNARVGAGRALINANIPWEYVTAQDLRSGLAGRYRVLYLPAMLAVSNDVFDVLIDYVRAGGRLVTDMPSFYFDELARMIPTGVGSRFEQLFGCTIDNFQHTTNVIRYLNGERLSGFVIDMTPTSADVLANYDTGMPAIAENKRGAGSAVILGYEAALSCTRPGNAAAERQLATYLLGAYRAPYECADAIVYRLCAPEADHYFLINDGMARTVFLDVRDRQYASGEDAVDGTPVDVRGDRITVKLPRESGVWLRMTKA